MKKMRSASCQDILRQSFREADTFATIKKMGVQYKMQGQASHQESKPHPLFTYNPSLRQAVRGYTAWCVRAAAPLAQGTVAPRSRWAMPDKCQQQGVSN